jgi:ring-1,2-phenylacetyl-CoA epoxidase subunit PaaE
MARPTEFHPLRVADVRRETEDTVSVAFEVPTELTEEFRYSPGQFLTFRVPDATGALVRRSYSICSGLDDGELRVAVKRLESGVFGVLANDSLKVGDTVEVLAPLGRFTTSMEPGRSATYLMIAAGSGITPVMSLMRTILARQPGSRITLLYGNRGPSSIIFREALHDLKDQHLQRLQVIHVLSREGQATPLLNGRITGKKLRELGASMLDLTAYDEVFVCGPEPMTMALRETLVELGIDASRVHLELFGSHMPPPPKRATAEDSGERVRLEVVLGGIRTKVELRPGDTVLEAASRTGLDMPFSCKGGVCATCRARVEEGAVEMAHNYALEPWEVDAGFVLTCQSRPTTPSLVVDYDAV